MKIYCYSCNKYVGLVRDASLMKNLAYLCPECKDELLPEPVKWPEDVSDPLAMLTKMFGMKK